MRRCILAAGTVLIFASTALADTAYVKPSTFSPSTDQTVTVEVAFNDYCCEPRYAVRTDTFAIIGPDGTVLTPDRVETFSTTTLLEHTFKQPGTSRITTGERLGRKGEYVFLEGEYFLVNSRDAEPIEIPEGTEILSSQTATVTDAYITVGAQDWGAIRTEVGRLAIQPALHPNTVRTGIPFIGRVTLDGEPVAGEDVIVTTEGERLRGVGGTSTKTDNEGVFSITFDEPGVALIMVRLQAPAPEDAETDIRSYTTALTLNVAER
ncbi:MAG: DUF4198 domain-containing protein [Pseudomonadota bacterium]